MVLRLDEKDFQDVMSRGGRGKAVKESKYKNVKTKGYDSKKEAERAQVLKYMQHCGEISELVEQPEFEIIPKQKGERRAVFTPDFQYMRDGVLVVEDVKSEATKTAAYVLRRKLLLYVHGIKLLET